MSPTRRTARRSRVLPSAALLLALSLTATACSGEFSRLGIPEPITEQAERVITLWQGSWVAALAVGAVVWGLIIWACIFHRKRSEELPPQVRYNLPIETLYTVVPLIMVAVFFYFTARDQNYLGEMSGRPDVKVKVEGFQWSWRFTTEYQGKTAQVVGVPITKDWTQGPELVLPSGGRTIEFDLHADEVIHSFWVPSFAFKRDVIPGVKNKFEVKTLNKNGTFAGRCAELCGADHSRMLFKVKLVPPSEFDAYINSQAGGAQ